MCTRARRSKRRSSCGFVARQRDKKASVLPYDEVDADDADRLLRLATVQKGGLGQHPHVAAALREEAVAADFALTLGEYWNTKTNNMKRDEEKAFKILQSIFLK